MAFKGTNTNRIPSVQGRASNVKLTALSLRSLMLMVKKPQSKTIIKDHKPIKVCILGLINVQQHAV